MGVRELLWVLRPSTLLRKGCSFWRAGTDPTSFQQTSAQNAWVDESAGQELAPPAAGVGLWIRSSLSGPQIFFFFMSHEGLQ